MAAVLPPARKPTTIMPRPTIVASQPTTNRPGVARPSMVKVEVPARCRVDGGLVRRARRQERGGRYERSRRGGRFGRSGRSGAADAVDGIARRGERVVYPVRSRVGRSVGRAQRSGSGSCAGAGIEGPAGRAWLRFGPGWPAADGRAAGAVAVVGEAPPGAAIRPVTSRACGSASMAAAGTSRRSKSLPHQAHSDQSIPTSRLQFGQTRFSRVRQDGQMIHSSSIRRSHDGQ